MTEKSNVIPFPNRSKTFTDVQKTFIALYKVSPRSALLTLSMLGVVGGLVVLLALEASQPVTKNQS
jgi:hypothetical protein